MRNIRLATVATMVLLLTSTLALAQTNASTNAVQQFHSRVMADAALLDVYASEGPGPKSVTEASKGQDDLKVLIKAALAAAQDKPDLVAAIKAYYIAANAYFESHLDLTGLPNYDPYTNSLVLNPKEVQQQHAQAQLKADLENKGSALKLEMQLAGLD